MSVYRTIGPLVFLVHRLIKILNSGQLLKESSLTLMSSSEQATSATQGGSRISEEGFI